MPIIKFILIAILIGLCVYGCDKLDAAINDPSEPLYTATGSTSDSEQNEYATVTLGNQEWMATNLQVTRFRDGSPIPEAKSSEEWKAAFDRREPVWSWINFDPTEGKKYGRLYNWFAVTDPRGLAPEGWAIPDSAAWMDLARTARLEATIFITEAIFFPETKELEGDFDADILEKTEVDWGDWRLFGSRALGNNMSGFNAIPGGLIDSEGNPVSLQSNSAWWGRDGLMLHIGIFCDRCQSQTISFFRRKNTQTGSYIRCVRNKTTASIKAPSE